ncbi:SGNH/GDSL hydrolase family protein [Roseofilum capinflatum]|uniref:SGNH/GDSL hydrolase family protein n=1 Tax=Roseofilum capinflatum BLCC-M114 TaxID=3022440 RepID=A0ABT7B923_9CYAN|nr:SGNH/GDSL hydrolase family protein [Roseofilum capinflatum]MDJ1175652.1 SGNH/GDSL hydrolase family protein [Roseofilum capinflatum BLCC-M114]
MPHLKTFQQFLKQFLIITVISFIFTEIGFRLYNSINPSFIFYDKSYGRFRGKPLSKHYDFTLNSQGYKDLEFETQKTEGIYRIIGIGDSFAFGVVPYEENYYTLVEEQLQAQNQSVELYNFGIPNLNPKDYLALLLNEGLNYDPDMIIVSFFLGNDFLDSRDQNLSQPLYTYSYVASFFKFLWDLQKSYEGQWELPENMVYDDNMKVFTDENYLAMEIRRSKIFIKNNPEFSQTFDYAMQFIDQMNEIAQQRDIEFLVVIIPDEVQVNMELQNQVIAGLDMQSEQFDFALPNRLMAEKLSSLNIDYLDLLEPFQSTSQTTRLYRPNDSHWNIAGNRLAATEIYKTILPKLSESRQD